MTRRLLVLTALFLVCSGYLARATRAEIVPIRQPLAQLPVTIGEWHGSNTPRFSAQVERVLGVDDYVSRLYARGRDPYVGLYVGYYASQRQGDTLHSPLNCLPGAGWQPVSRSSTAIPVGSGQVIHVNQFLIEKGIERQVVFYWYQSHGRVVASEYTSKAYMVYDAIRSNRTDAALVRVTTPITPSDGDQRAAAARLVSFVQSMFPLLGSHLPS